MSRWVKKGRRAALSQLRRREQQGAAGPAGRQPAAVIAYDEMGTYQQARHGDQRPDLWLWTAVAAEPDSRRWADFEVGDRSENTFQRMYARRPEAEWHRSDAYGVYQSWLPPGSYAVGKGGAVNWNEGVSILYLHRSNTSLC